MKRPAMFEQNQEFLHKLLQKIPGVVTVWRVTPEGNSEALYMNEPAEELFGLPRAEIMANPMGVFNNWHPDDSARILEVGTRAFQELSSFTESGRIRRADGSTRWVRCISEPERQPDGSVLWFTTFFDISNEKLIEEDLRASRAQRAEEEELFRAIIDNMPIGVLAADQQGKFVAYNPAVLEIFGIPAGTDITNAPFNFEMFEADGETPVPVEQMPIARALYGEAASREVVIRGMGHPEGVLLNIEALPLERADGTRLALTLSRDITQQRALEDELRERNRQLGASEEEKSQLVARLRYAIDELSNPILEVWDDILAMPLIGVVDSRRTADMAQRLLSEVSRTQAQHVIIDLTGVEVVDTKTADNLIKLVRKVELIGARCVVTGIRPSVAETLVEIGVDFTGLTTLRNLKHGLQGALGSRSAARRGAEPAEEGGEAAEPARRRSGR